MQNLEVKESGLKCDSPSCDWAISNEEIGELSDYINRPCPKCGENVLTYEDFKTYELVKQYTEALNVLTPGELEEVKNMLPPEAVEQAKAMMPEGFQENNMVSFHVDTHKGINISDIKKVEL